MNAFMEQYLAIVWALSAAIAVLALVLGAYLYRLLRSYRRDQKVVMGEGKERDLVAHARALQGRMDGIAMDLGRLTEELAHAESRIDDCLTFRSVIRYDAYRDLSGMQSTTMALLDTQFSGVVVSAIQSREDARIYVKEIRHGDSREKLSPEEIQVLKEAMGLKTGGGRKQAVGEGTGA